MAKWEVVKNLSRVFRFTTVFLLLFVAAEVFACDLVHSDDCYISAWIPSQDNNHAPPLSGDSCNCLCCCAHMVAVPAFSFHPVSVVTLAPPSEITLRPLSVASDIEHPPQLS